MNFYGADGMDFAMLIIFTIFGSVFIMMGIWIIEAGPSLSLILACFTIPAGIFFIAMVNHAVWGDIIKRYRKEQRIRERQDITRDEPWTEERI